MTAAARPGTDRSLSAGAATVALAIAVLIVAMLRHQRSVRGGGEALGAGPRQDRVAWQPERALINADGKDREAIATAAEDLEADRRFERSLVAREAAVVAVIAALIVVRQLLS